MSVIVAKSSVCCGSIGPVSYDCFPAVSVQRIIPVGSTLTIDGIPTGGFSAAQWLVVVSNAGGTRVRSYQIFATHRNGANPTFGQRSSLGSAISHTPNIVVSSGTMNFTVANTDVEDLIVYATRTAIPLSNTQTNALDVVEVGKGSALVRAGQTSTLDFVTPAQMVAATWLITITTAVGERASSQVFAQITNDIVASHYGLTGDAALGYQVIITEVVGLGVEFAVENTSAVDYRINFTRIPVQVGSIVPYCGVGAGVNLWIPPGTSIASGSTANIDLAPLPAHTGVKWLFCATDTVTHNTMACEINATNPTGASATHVLWGIIADYLDLDVTTTNSGGNIVLTVKNNELNVITVNLLRVPTGS